MQRFNLVFLLKKITKSLFDNFLLENFLKKFIIKNLLVIPRPIILVFHMIAPIDKNGIPQIENLKVSPEFFKYIIKVALSHGRYFLSPDDLYKSFCYKEKLNNNSILITFDDGYKDNFIYAYPILKKYNIPFTIYINSGFINKEFYPWWFAISDLIKQKEVIFHDKKKFNVNSILKKERFYLFMRDKLINSSKDKINKCLKILSEENQYNFVLKNNLFMSWEEIKKLLKYPKFVLGTHTYSHLNLSILDKKQIEEEVDKDITEIEKKAGVKVKHISYPFGLVNKKVISVIKSLPINTGVSTKSGFVSLKCNILNLPRLFLREKPSNLLKLYFETKYKNYV